MTISSHPSPLWRDTTRRSLSSSRACHRSGLHRYGIRALRHEQQHLQGHGNKISAYGDTRAQEGIVTLAGGTLTSAGPSVARAACCIRRRHVGATSASSLPSRTAAIRAAGFRRVARSPSTARQRAVLPIVRPSPRSSRTSRCSTAAASTWDRRTCCDRRHRDPPRPSRLWHDCGEDAPNPLMTDTTAADACSLRATPGTFGHDIDSGALLSASAVAGGAGPDGRHPQATRST